MAPHMKCVPEDVEACLKDAERVCRARGGNLTPLRKKVLTALLEADAPTGAYELLTCISDDREAKPPTIYRTLDFLLTMGLVHRIASQQAYVPCRHWGHPHTAAILLCDDCGRADELDVDSIMADFRSEAASVSFRSDRAIIEIHGYCPDCRTQAM
jgi:Fur family transcriptional regulator, zinc uptake regulator